MGGMVRELVLITGFLMADVSHLNADPVSSPAGFGRSWKSHRPFAVEGLTGRILRGQEPEDFLSLSPDPARPLVFLLDPMGLARLTALEGRALLEEVGYTPDYIAQLVDTGHRFRLVVFPEGAARRATWSNVLTLLESVDPPVGRALNPHLESLKTTPFSRIEAGGPLPFSTIRTAGPDGPHFIDRERFLAHPDDLWHARAYLYLVAHLTELFGGDGWTLRPDGTRGPPELVTRNRPLHELEGLVILDLEMP